MPPDRACSPARRLVEGDPTPSRSEIRYSPLFHGLTPASRSVSVLSADSNWSIRSRKAAISLSLAAGSRVAVLEGDLATTKDAERIAALDVPVVQLLTEGGCHLTPTLVQEGMRRLPLDEIDLLLIENVGNPICPANFDLGEHFRVAVLSVTEGDDKPAKYPYLFKVADLVVVTKTDLLASTDFDFDEAVGPIRAFDPEKPILRTSINDPAGFQAVAERLTNVRDRSPRETHRLGAPSL